MLRRPPEFLLRIAALLDPFLAPWPSNVPSPFAFSGAVGSALARGRADQVEEADLDSVAGASGWLRGELGSAEHPVPVVDLALADRGRRPVGDLEGDGGLGAGVLQPVWPARRCCAGVADGEVEGLDRRELTPAEEHAAAHQRLDLDRAE